MGHIDKQNKTKMRLAVFFLTIPANSRLKGGLLVLYLGVLGLLPACTVIDTQAERTFQSSANWVLLPFLNYSETPRAGEKVGAIVATLLRAGGVTLLSVFSQDYETEGLPELNDRRVIERSIKWAQENKFNYAVTGNVDEWRYKAGVGGEPAVGLSIQIIEVASRTVVWSASGARAGWSTESLSATAQKLVRKLLSDLEISKT